MERSPNVEFFLYVCDICGEEFSTQDNADDHGHGSYIHQRFVVARRHIKEAP